MQLEFAAAVQVKGKYIFSKLRGRRGNGRRGRKTMERGKGKGSRIIAYLTPIFHLSIGLVSMCQALDIYEPTVSAE